MYFGHARKLSAESYCDLNIVIAQCSLSHVENMLCSISRLFFLCVCSTCVTGGGFDVGFGCWFCLFGNGLQAVSVFWARLQAVRLEAMRQFGEYRPLNCDLHMVISKYSPSHVEIFYNINSCV